MTVWINRVYATMLLDLIQFFRYRLAVASSVFTPLVMVLSFALGTKTSTFTVDGTSYIAFMVPGIMAVGTMFSAIFSSGYSIIADRQRRLIDDIVLSPISYSAFMLGRVLSTLVKSSLQFIAVALVAVIALNMPCPHLVPLAFAYCMTAVLFGATGTVLACWTDMLSFGGVANMVTLPLMYFCGVFFPIAYFGELFRFLRWIPVTAAIELFRYSFSGTTTVGTLLANTLVLATCALAALAMSVVTFRRTVLRT